MNRDTAAKKIMRESLGGTASREKPVRLYTVMTYFCVIFVSFNGPNFACLRL